MVSEHYLSESRHDLLHTDDQVLVGKGKTSKQLHDHWRLPLHCNHLSSWNDRVWKSYCGHYPLHKNAVGVHRAKVLILHRLPQVFALVLQVLPLVPGKVYEVHQQERLHHVCHQEYKLL